MRRSDSVAAVSHRSIAGNRVDDSSSVDLADAVAARFSDEHVTCPIHGDTAGLNDLRLKSRDCDQQGQSCEEYASACHVPCPFLVAFLLLLAARYRSGR